MHVLITAGPTQEPIDDVRFIGNRSSGRMGLALARAAADAGHAVTLLLGPITQPPDLPPRVAVHRFRTTAELGALLEAHGPACDLLLMAAAVADFRPAAPVAGKLARGERLTLELEPTPDLVAAFAARAAPHQRVVAFALEPAADLLPRATAKLRRKGVHAIVANPLDTMDADTINGTLIRADGTPTLLSPYTKAAFAAWLIDALVNPPSP